jgi:hypothetical protein
MMAKLGWVLVHLEPTQLMNDHGIEALDRLAGENNCKREHLNEVWRTMIAAAPPAPLDSAT